MINWRFQRKEKKEEKGRRSVKKEIDKENIPTAAFPSFTSTRSPHPIFPPHHHQTPILPATPHPFQDPTCQIPNSFWHITFLPSFLPFLFSTRSPPPIFSPPFQPCFGMPHLVPSTLEPRHLPLLCALSCVLECLCSSKHLLRLCAKR